MIFLNCFLVGAIFLVVQPAKSLRINATLKREGLCDTLVKVDKSQLRPPFPGIRTPPWADPSVAVWNSSEVARRVDAMLDQPVKCLKPYGTTYRQVFDTFLKEGCWVFLFGGPVRDIIRGRTVTSDLDTETSCTLQQAIEICERHYGADQCFHSPKILHFGGSRQLGTFLDMSPWDETMFGDGSALEFSANALAYDLSQHVILDMTGHQSGPFDACDMLIKVPLLERTKLRLDNAKTTAMNRRLCEKWHQLNDAFRYWKLRQKGFHCEPGDSITINFVTSEIRRLFEKQQGRDKLQRKYCRYALEGKIEKGSNVCLTDRDCSKLNDYDNYLTEDFNGSSDKSFWETSLKPLFKRTLKCRFTATKTCYDAEEIAEINRLTELKKRDVVFQKNVSNEYRNTSAELVKHSKFVVSIKKVKTKNDDSL